MVFPFSMNVDVFKTQIFGHTILKKHLFFDKLYAQLSPKALLLVLHGENHSMFIFQTDYFSDVQYFYVCVVFM